MNHIGTLLMLHLVFCLFLAIQTARGADEQAQLVYIGTYSNFELLSPPRRAPNGDKSKGIYAFRFDSASGALTPLGVAAETINPTFIALHPDRPLLYAVNEIYQFNGEATGAVSAFSMDAGTGKLTFLNQISSRGTGPCYLRVDPSGRNVLVANFGSGSVAVLPTDEEGRLKSAAAFEQHSGSGPSPRQAGPHTHSFNLTPDNRFAVAAEFGADKLFVYHFDSLHGYLVANDPPFVAMKPGSGPRHFTFAPNGKIAYVLNEISSTITAFSYDKGIFTEIETVSTLPPDFKGSNTAAEVQVHPSGKFLYASNRGHHSIAIFTIDAEGRLGPPSHIPVQGRTPRNFSLDSQGKWLIAANQDTNNIAVFRINPDTGMLEPNGQSQSVPTPLFVRFWQPVPNVGHSPLPPP